MSDHRTLIERYDTAATAGQIVVTAEHRTAADYLLAAAHAQASSPRNRAAVALQRLQLKLTQGGVDDVRSWAVPALARHFARGRHPLRPAGAAEVFNGVMVWWLAGMCSSCRGRRFTLLPGGQAVSTTPCPDCAGRGREPVHQHVPQRQHDAARWLADQFEDMLSFVEADMQRRLGGAL
jgi:hypothetical protein